MVRCVIRAQEVEPVRRSRGAELMRHSRKGGSRTVSVRSGTKSRNSSFTSVRSDLRSDRTGTVRLPPLREKRFIGLGDRGNGDVLVRPHDQQ